MFNAESAKVHQCGSNCPWIGSRKGVALLDIWPQVPWLNWPNEKVGLPDSWLVEMNVPQGMSQVCHALECFLRKEELKVVALRS